MLYKEIQLYGETWIVPSERLPARVNVINRQLTRGQSAISRSTLLTAATEFSCGFYAPTSTVRLESRTLTEQHPIRHDVTFIFPASHFVRLFVLYCRGIDTHEKEQN